MNDEENRDMMKLWLIGTIFPWANMVSAYFSEESLGLAAWASSVLATIACIGAASAHYVNIGDDA